MVFPSRIGMVIFVKFQLPAQPPTVGGADIYRHRVRCCRFTTPDAGLDPYRLYQRCAFHLPSLPHTSTARLAVSCAACNAVGTLTVSIGACVSPQIESFVGTMAFMLAGEREHLTLRGQPEHMC
jgi:hypothetical protein